MTREVEERQGGLAPELETGLSQALTDSGVPRLMLNTALQQPSLTQHPVDTSAASFRLSFAQPSSRFSQASQLRPENKAKASVGVKLLSGTQGGRLREGSGKQTHPTKCRKRPLP